MDNFQEDYFFCFTERRIYHSKLESSKREDKILMLEHGITNKERWEKIPLSKALSLCAEWKEDNFFGICTAPKYEIIDCPELSEYQKNLDIWGRLIVFVEQSKRQSKSEDLDFMENMPKKTRNRRSKKDAEKETPPLDMINMEFLDFDV